jgi:hypothetical protein
MKNTGVVSSVSIFTLIPQILLRPNNAKKQKKLDSDTTAKILVGDVVRFAAVGFAVGLSVGFAAGRPCVPQFIHDSARQCRVRAHLDSCSSWGFNGNGNHVECSLQRILQHGPCMTAAYVISHFRFAGLR